MSKETDVTQIKSDQSFAECSYCDSEVEKPLHLRGRVMREMDNLPASIEEGCIASIAFDVLMFLRQCDEEVLREHGVEYLRRFLELRGLPGDWLSGWSSSWVLGLRLGWQQVFNHHCICNRLEWCRCGECERLDDDAWQALLSYIQEDLNDDEFGESEAGTRQDESL